MKSKIEILDEMYPQLKHPTRPPLWIMWIVLAICMIILLTQFAWAKETYTDEQIAQAIYYAEGGTKTKYPYGIKSIPTYGNKEYAYKICLNTIRNNKKRFAKQNKYTDFIEFLGSRYCPPQVHRLNKNWVRNVKYYLKKLK